MAIMGLFTGEVLSTNLFAYCGNNPVMNVDPSGMLYISYKQLASVFQTISNMSMALRIHTNKGLWGTLAGLAAPYISLAFSWVNSLPVVGQVVFVIIVTM